MKIARDLLYDKKNEHLDISRVSALLSVLAYIGMSMYFIGIKPPDIVEFDFFEWASGWAALAAGNAAWIYARQRIEMQMDFKPMNARGGSPDGGMYGSGGYNYAPYDFNYGGHSQNDEAPK